MIKGFILAVVFCSVCMVGVLINKNKKKRLEFFKDFQTYLNFADDGIRNVRLPKTEINRKVSPSIHGDFQNFLNDSSIPKYINDIEKNELNSFFSKFGELDLDCTLEAVSSEKIKAGVKVDECEKDLKNKGGMIIKLCILGGIALVILLI